MKKKSIFLILLAVVCASFSVVGCSAIKDKREDSSSTDVAMPQDKHETSNTKVLRLSMRITQTLNPIENGDESVDEILSIMFEKLVRIDESGKVVPNIADSWNFSEDGKTLSMHIKSGLIWHDGSAITANDVAFTLNSLRNANENAYYKDCINNILSWTVVDANTINISFNSSYIGNIYYMSFPVISSGYYGTGEDKSMKPMGNSAYAFSSYIVPRELKLVAKENSFTEIPKTSEISVLITPDTKTDLYSFDRGIIDVLCANETDFAQYDTSKKSNSFEFTTRYYDFLGFNFKNPILQDKNVRRATALCLDRESIVKSVYLENAIETYTPVSPESWLYEKTVEDYPYDITLAKTVLEQSSWRYRTNDRVRERDTNGYHETLKLRILVNSENEERRQLASRISEQLIGIGFDIVIETLPFAEYNKKLQDKDFDMFIGGYELSPIQDFRFMLHSSAIEGGSNYISYNSVAMDERLDACVAENNAEETQKAYSEMQKYIAQEIPYLSFVFREAAVFTRENITGMLSPCENDVFNGIENIIVN